MVLATGYEEVAKGGATRAQRAMSLLGGKLVGIPLVSLNVTDSTFVAVYGEALIGGIKINF